VALSQAPFILFRLVLRNPDTNERADQAPCCARRAYAGQRRHDGPRGDERTNAGDGERADADQPSEHSTDDGAGTRAGGGAFGSLGVRLMCQRLVPRRFLHQHRHVAVSKSCRTQVIDSPLERRLVGE